ncbi:hypothetical protein K0M31_006907 [Melipona bicolor]|uniref:Uncharacterized protein n=1 Tax=Melipona bicolor TaxID=60889 RepID=A0AA40FRW3_9HYME|nr:hypothetical protein K0M31_006907 [Melipona bicolor]
MPSRTKSQSSQQSPVRLLIWGSVNYDSQYETSWCPNTHESGRGLRKCRRRSVPEAGTHPRDS